jgi:hypothetical protein
MGYSVRKKIHDNEIFANFDWYEWDQTMKETRDSGTEDE